MFPDVNCAEGTNTLAPLATAPFTDRYSTSIRLPALGATPNVTPSPKDSSKYPLGDSFRI